MALSTATRRPISSRTAPASRARTVRCTAQHSGVSRHLLAAGAAVVVALGPSAAPAQAIWQYLPFGESIKNAIAQPTATEQTPVQKAGDVLKNEQLTLRDKPQTQPSFPANLLNAKADDDSGASTTPVSTPKLGANEQAPFGGDKSKVDSPAGSAADIRATAAQPERPVRGAETPSLASPIAGQVDVELAAKTVEAENQPAPK